MKTKNTNCLDGFRCPTCGSLEPFHIEATVTVKVYDSGTDDASDFEWGDDSYCCCLECGQTGKVKEFKHD